MKKIIYISDYAQDMSIAEEEYKVIESVYGKEYSTMHLKLDFLNPKEADKQMKATLSDESNEILIAKGIGSFFAIYCGGNRVKVSLFPKVKHFGFAEELEERYEAFRKETKKGYFDCRRSSAAIVSTENLKFDVFVYASFCKNIHAWHGTGVTADMLNTMVTPLFDTLSRYEWWDEYGVHYINYGRCIDDVNHWIFDKFEEYTIPDSVISMGPELFVLSKLRKITIGAGLHEIPEHSFSQCSYLKEIEIQGPRLWKIADRAFDGCISLENINLSRTCVSVIGDYAFSGTRLKFIELPDNITHCPQSALPDGCKVVISRGKYEQLLKSDYIMSHIEDEGTGDEDFNTEVVEDETNDRIIESYVSSHNTEEAETL